MSVTETIKKIKLKITIGSYVIKRRSGIELSDLKTHGLGLSSQINNSVVAKSLDTKIHSLDTTNVKKCSMGSYVIKGISGIKPSELIAQQLGLSSQSNNSGVGLSLNTMIDTTSVKKHSMGSKKRSLSESMKDGQKKKRRKMDKSEILSIEDESALHETKMSSCSRAFVTDTATTSLEGSEPSVDVQLSIHKALRAVSLKNRFANTILKAKQKATQNQVDKADPMKIKKELERQDQKERARIQARSTASKETARKREEAEMKLQRQKERKAARLALQQMVQTVDIYNDHKIVKDLVLLSGCSFSDQYSCSSYESSPEVSSGEGGQFSRALEKLGLFIKDDHYIEYENDDRAVTNGHGDLEEGEIFS